MHLRVAQRKERIRRYWGIRKLQEQGTRISRDDALAHVDWDAVLPGGAYRDPGDLMDARRVVHWMRKQFNARQFNVFFMWLDGWTYREIGEALGGRCPERARQMLLTVLRATQYKWDELYR